MLKSVFNSLLFLFVFGQCIISDTAAQSPVHEVNVFIGTAAHGHTHPAATLPFGMVQLGPDTRIDPNDWDGASGYHYSDSLIYGFSHTHLSGTGVSDFCDLLIQPFCGDVALEPTQYASAFQKKKEKASPGYYSVFLEKHRIQCEMTATERVGVHRYTFPTNREQGRLLLDLRHRDQVLDSKMTIVNDHEIEGYRTSSSWAKEQHFYFVVRFSKAFYNSNVLDLSKKPHVSERSANSKAVAGIFDFYPGGEPIVVKVGISGTSIEGARRNLDVECPDFDFDFIQTKAEQAWAAELSKIEITDGTPAQRTTFYTALYHSLLAPNLWSDADGRYRGRDNRVHPDPGHKVYHVFSLWDTYRACLPLQALLCPDRVHDMVKTFLRQYEQSGKLPVWELAANETDCMIGQHSIPVIFTALQHNLIDEEDKMPLLNAAIAAVEGSDRGRLHYRTRGYIPADEEPESVSKTIEYAVDDWYVAQIAYKLGQVGKNGETGTFEQYRTRSENALNLFDPKSGFFRGKANGSWQVPFDPTEVNHQFTEANAWQYRFAMGQIADLELDENKLNELFETKSAVTGRNQVDITGLIGQYAHGNEPCHHVAYLFNRVGKPERAQSIVRQIMSTLYSDQPDGLCGNDDCGQLSAWYVWSALGLYPVTPGFPLEGGAPLFKEVKLHLDSGNVVITTKDLPKNEAYLNGSENRPTQSISLPTNVFDYLDEGKEDTIFLLAGKSHLIVYPQNKNHLLDSRPSLAKTDSFFMGYSAGKRLHFYKDKVPVVAKGERVFMGEQTIELWHPIQAARSDSNTMNFLRKNTASFEFPATDILYSIGHNPPTNEGWEHYSKPFEIKESATIYFKASTSYHEKTSQKYTYLTKYHDSPVDSAVFTKKTNDLRVLRYNTSYSTQYTARGEGGLTDLLRGGIDFRSGGCQGYEGVNMDIVLDQGKKMPIQVINAHFLQDENAWIFYPTKVTFEVSDDGKNFKMIGEAINTVPVTATGTLQQNFTFQLPKPISARYICVVGVTRGLCPATHKGAGYPSWLFVDEVEVR